MTRLLVLLFTILLLVGTACGGPPKGVVLNERMEEFCLALLVYDGPNFDRLNLNFVESGVVISELYETYSLLELAMEACDAWADWSEDRYPGGSGDQY